MRKINKNSRRGIVNLFADFILSRIDKKENSIIQVTDCESFMVINGITTSDKVLDLEKIKSEFSGWFDSELKDVGIDKINTFDLIRYEQDVTVVNEGWVDINQDVFIEEKDLINSLSISSEFPYGYSLNCGRSMVYYSHYIFNHMYSLLGVDNLKFYFSNELDDEEDFKIKIISNSIQKNETIKSLILDVFSFDLKEFNESIKDYDLMQDILSPDKEKPYLRQDMLKHVVLF